ncbi:MAG: YceH family protein [Steroidobacteraceae bacterium]
MRVELDSFEARVIGCLIEKQVTTPDQYPLSINALVNACNQKSNRDPVMDLDESAVQRTLDALSRRHLVLERSGFGSRVPKYQHLFCNTEYGSLKFAPQELAVVCELLLRGPQMPGELRARASRLAPIADVSEVEAVLQGLLEREPRPLVERLPREPGRREARYRHLFGGEHSPPSAAVGAAPQGPARGAAIDGTGGAATAGAERLATEAESLETAEQAASVRRTEREGDGALATRVARLEEEIRRLRIELDELRSRG